MHRIRSRDGDGSDSYRCLYGSGLRLLECLRLRVKGIDFQRHEITVRDGKGGKDRVTMLPEAVRAQSQGHLERVHRQHTRDLARDLGRTPLPDGPARKYPDADRVQRTVKEAVRQAGLTKPASCHSFRHSFATHLLDDPPGWMLG